MDSFFGIGAPELVVILIIAGVVMGPERIAHIARWFGKTTAQLQTISRAFMHQLTQELDGVDDGEALKDALGEMQALRQELETLKGEFTSITAATTLEGQKAIQDIQDAQHSILPPSLSSVTNNGQKDDDAETAVSANGSNSTPSTLPTPLPTPIKVEDDPE